MFVTATNELKFNNWPDDDVEERYSPNVVSEIASLSWSKDNKFIVYLQKGGRPEILNVKDVANVKPVHVVTAIDDATVVMFQKHTKKCVAMGTASGTVALYDTKTKSIGRLFTVPGCVVSLDFNCADGYLGVATVTGSVVLFDLADGVEACSYIVEGACTFMQFHSKNPGVFAVGTAEGMLYIYKVKDATPIYSAKCHNSTLNGLVFCTHKDLLVTVGQDNIFCVHDLGVRSCTFTGYLQYPLTCADVNADGRYLAIGTEVGSVVIYDTRSFITPMLILKPHDTKIKCIKFSNKGGNFDDLENISICTNRTELTVKIREDNDFKSMYQRIVNKSEDETLRLLKEDIVADLQDDARQLRVQMNVHMENLQEFIRKEFEKITEQMDDRYQLLDMMSGSYNMASITSESVLQNFEDPIILE